MDPQRIEDVSLSDLLTFLAVLRCGSFSGVAHERKVTPSQVSRAVSRLERQFGRALFRRTAKGIVPTENAPWVQQEAEAALLHLNRLKGATGAETEDTVTVAAEGDLLELLLPAVFRALSPRRVNLVEMSASEVRGQVSEAASDVLLTRGEAPLSPRWVTTRIGSLSYGLFATPETARRLKESAAASARKQEEEDRTGLVLVEPTQWSKDVPPRTVKGHIVASFRHALRVARIAGQVTWAPLLLARPFLEGGELVQVPHEGPARIEDVQLACHGDRVTRQIQRRLITELSSVFAPT